MPEKQKSNLYDYPNNPSVIDPSYPIQSVLTDAHMKNTITSDMVSVTRAVGKIPIGNPNNNGIIDPDWFGVDPNASYAIEASTEAKGVIEIATLDEARAGIDNSRAVTPAGVKESINANTPKATTSQSGLVTLTNTIDNSQDKAVTPYAVKNYLSSSNFAKATYDGYGITKFASVANTTQIVTDSASKPVNTLKNDTKYKENAIDPYSLYNYISNKDLYLNVNKQTVGGIVFRSLVENDTASAVTATERARLYVNKDNGTTYLKVNNKTVTLVDNSGNSSFPGNVTATTSVITPVVKQSNGAAPKLGTKAVGSVSKPIYIANDGTITECNTIDNVNTANKATKDGNGNVIASTYLPLAGGTMTGPIYRNDSSVTNGSVTVLWGVVGANDQWGIRAGATDTDSGYLELATGDNAQEPIYVRQYSGGGFATLKRTATLLDSSGNTSFPGDLFVNDVKSSQTGSWWVDIAADKAIIQSTATSGAYGWLNGYTKDYKVMFGAYPGSNNIVYLSSYTKDNVNKRVNTSKSSLSWDAETNTVTATKFKGSLEGTASVATKLGTATVGGTSKPIYLNAGTPTAISSTVGSASKPVYLNGGTITAISSTVGSVSKPVYLNGGTITAISSTVGSASKPVYLNGGTVTALSSTVGGANSQPVYLNSGTITGVTKVDIAHGGTNATTRTAAVKSLFNQGVETEATHILGITSDWSKCGYISKANLKSMLGIKAIWNEPTKTLLFGSATDKSKRIGDGVITLSQSYDKFDALLIVSSNDGASILTTTIIPVWELKLRNKLAKDMDIPKFELPRTTAGNFWFIDKSSTTTALIERDSNTYYENSSILAIYGLKW